VNLRDLQYLIAVAETRHFGRAAQRCFVSQPTLSGQIKKLEEFLGVMLFERTNRSVTITPAGENILAHARKIMEQADAIEQLARSYQDPLAGPLRLGAIPTISPYLMPLILKPLQKQVAQMRLVLSEEKTDTLLARLHNHEIDAALLATAHPETDFKSVPLYREPFWLAFPRDHAFYTYDHIGREDLENTQLLLLSEGHCFADQVMDVCNIQERGLVGDMSNLRAASLETLLQLVSAGYGSTLVPALALGGSWASGSGIVTIRPDMPDAWRRVSLYYRPSFPRPQALTKLIEVIKASLPNTVYIEND
jgi:LysR family hydrogen peroxide-inducible transcriptional activator